MSIFDASSRPELVIGMPMVVKKRPVLCGVGVGVDVW
jgi:hypothetical protein